MPSFGGGDDFIISSARFELSDATAFIEHFRMIYRERDIDDARR